MELRKVISYRIDFWVQFLGNVITQIVLAYFLWRSIFTYLDVEELRGYDFPSLMLYYVLVPLIDRMVRGPEMNHIAQEIYDGGLNRYLIYPISFFFYKYATHIAQSLIFTAQFLFAASAYLFIFGLPEIVHFSIYNLLMGVGAVMTGSVLYFFLVATLEMIAFWADHVWSLLVMMRFILYFTGGGMIPLSFFPESVRTFLEYLPFPYLSSFPVRSFMGEVDPGEFVNSIFIVLVWSAVQFVFAYGVWRSGLKRYSGIGI